MQRDAGDFIQRENVPFSLQVAMHFNVLLYLFPNNNKKKMFTSHPSVLIHKTPLKFK